MDKMSKDQISKDNFMAKSYSTVNIEESEDIHIITMNRPERRNALNPQLIHDLSQALEAATRCSCGVVVLTGAGTSFCSGMDLEHIRLQHDQRPEEQLADAEAIMWLMRHLHGFTKPTIAAVNGPAVAGGAGLAALCDFTLSVPGAKFGFTEVKVGFIPAVVAVFLLPILGDKRTRDLLLSGRILDAEEALAFGLVTAITPAAELMEHTRAVARSLLKNSPASMRAVKELLNGFAKERLDRYLVQAVRWNERVRNSGDFREGLQAFFEKRDAVWPSLARKGK
jgi:methylglutaconyl-CoA hydratase